MTDHAQATTELALSIKDYVVLLAGAIFGVYSSLVAGRMAAFQSLRNDVIYQLQVLAPLLRSDAHELDPDIALHRRIEARAFEAYFLGHLHIHRQLHSVAREMQAAYEQIRSGSPGEFYSLTNFKTRWIDELLKIHPRETLI